MDLDSTPVSNNGQFTSSAKKTGAFANAHSILLKDARFKPDEKDFFLAEQKDIAINL
jgi:hypothetical protein